MEKLLVLSNFFFCHYVFKKPSAAGQQKASIWGKGLNSFLYTTNLQQMALRLLVIISYWIQLKTLLQKDKMLAHDEQYLLLLYCFLLQMIQNVSTCGKELKLPYYHIKSNWYRNWEYQTFCEKKTHCTFDTVSLFLKKSHLTLSNI